MQFSRKSKYKTYSETDVVETLQEVHKKEMISSLVKIQLIASDFHRWNGSCVKPGGVEINRQSAVNVIRCHIYQTCLFC